MAAKVGMQSELFLDTSYVIALSTPKDNHNAEAVTLSEEIKAVRPRLITSRGVLLEVVNALSELKYRPTAVGILEALSHDPRLEIFDLSAELYETALKLYSDRPDKQWGLTDCLSFVIMDLRGITQALTADFHFVQAGYQALMRSPKC